MRRIWHTGSQRPSHGFAHNPQSVVGGWATSRVPLQCTASGSQQQCIPRALAQPWPESQSINLDPPSSQSRPPRIQHLQPSLSAGASKLSHSSNQGASSRAFLPHELTAALKAARTPQELIQLCTEQQHVLNFIHASAALNRLAKMIDGTRTKDILAASHSVHAISNLVLQHAPEFQSRALANALWATSKLLQALTFAHQSTTSQTYLSDAVNQQAQDAMSALRLLATILLDMLPQLTHDFEPQHYANSVYSIGIIHSCAQRNGKSISPATAAWQSVEGGQGGEEEQDSQLSVDTLRTMAAELLQRSTPHVQHMTTQGISNMLYGSAQLGLQPDPAWMDAALDALMHMQRHMEPQHVASTLWAMAKLGYYPGDEWLDSVMDHVVLHPQRLLNRFTPQGLANCLWALAVLQAAPQPHVMTHLLASIRSHAQAFGAQDVSNVLWALAELWRLVQSEETMTPADSLTSLTSLDLPGSQASEQEELGKQSPSVLHPGSGTSMADSTLTTSGTRSAVVLTDQQGEMQAAGMHVLLCCIQHQLSSSTSSSSQSAAGGPATAASHKAQARPPALWGASPQQLANILWGASVLQLSLPRHWYGLFWRASYGQLRGMGRQEVAMTMLALGRLRAVPPAAWLTRLQQVSLRQLPDATPKQLSHCIWAMARLRVLPHPIWQEAFVKQVQRQGPQLGPKASACISKSLTKLGLEAPGL